MIDKPFVGLLDTTHLKPRAEVTHKRKSFFSSQPENTKF